MASALLLATTLPFSTTAQPTKPAPPTAPYTWKSVQMVGGGFVDGIVFHPKEKGLRYCRTDMGGAYRWNDATKRWEPLLDWVSYEDTNLMGVESIGLDPADPNRLYLACGTYTNPRAPNAAVLRSNDRGKTFQRTNMPFKMGGNENGRGNGERLAVDPNNGNILYLGTRHDGLWRSLDRGATWSQVESFPDIQEVLPANLSPEEQRRSRQNQGSGVVFAVFDPRSGTRGKGSSTLYVGASLMGRDNLWRSTDAGATWQPVPGQPTQYRPGHAVLAPDGTLYLSYGTSPGPSQMRDGGIWKLNTATNAWMNITPDKPDPAAGRTFGYGAVAVDARHPQWLIASSFGRYQAGGEDLFRSTDGGKSWKPVFKGANPGTYDYTLAPYVKATGIHWLLDIEIDPFDSNHALFTTGYGGHETFNLTDVEAGKPSKWSVMSTGIEETVALELLSPPKGAHLVSAIGDYGGFVHRDLDKPAPEGNFTHPHFANTDGVACAELKPETLVRVGVGSHQVGGGNIGYSLDGGQTWNPTPAAPQPTSQRGHIAVGADGRTWIWTPEKSAPYVTADQGATWTAVQGLPDNTRVLADRLNPRTFYALDLFGGQLFTSLDAGLTFSAQPLTLPNGLPQTRQNRGDIRGGQDRLYAAPTNTAGDLWLAAFDGLYHAPDAGKTFTKAAAVQEIHGFGFGKAAPGAAYPALYLIGVVNGTRGFFRSTDAARTWTRINDDQHQWGLVLHITGDPKQYGRVYVGTHGRGTFYGDEVKNGK
ncbi:xyloglucanase [Hymenobacter sp.]|uniref:xyloglucanase n=1 Tax=Hymenobacter sp. TaxID=1898978 RepID=UPI002ED8B6A8